MDNNLNGNAFPQQPKDYKTWSIVNLVISIIFCCGCTGIIALILSIIALIKSNDVVKYNNMGESSALLAQDASKTAKTLNLISSILLVAGFIFSIVYFAIFGATQLANMMQL